MPRGLVTLFVAIEALFVVGIGIGIPLVPLLVAWGSANQFQATPLDIWQLAVQVWALGHGTPLSVNLSGAGTIFPPEMMQFDITLALSGIALITGLMAIRAGRRIAETEDSPIVGGLLIAIFTTLTGFALWSAQSATVNISVTLGTIKIAAPFIVGLLVGWKPWRLFPRLIERASETLGQWRDVVATALRISVGAFLGLAVLASAVLAWSIISGFTAEIALYEAIHGQVFGGLVITVGQLLLIPTAVVWTMSWLVGPGFSLGLGTLVNPFTATVGAIPAVPLLGAIPAESVVGWPALIMPFLIVVAVAVGFSERIVGERGYFDPTGSTDFIRLGVLTVASGIFSGLAFLIIGSGVSGSAGPGRFIFVGVDPVDIALAWGTMVTMGTAVGAAVRVIRPLPRNIATVARGQTR
ncbi:MAG: hypothetical protein F2574_03845 [Actinobacteria bacterium]|uniref:Unannotated protein n=1 Tax=freshwater metagenome TaxID=449393 RepID=A0A6J6G3N8_9ZZZZ|nr:hypothetical protein [Actinomycetota bacterium]